MTEIRDEMQDGGEITQLFCKTMADCLEKEVIDLPVAERFKLVEALEEVEISLVIKHKLACVLLKASNKYQRYLGFGESIIR